KAYAKKLWTRHELKQAQARAFEENREYILPVRIDDTKLPGLNATTAYMDARRHDATALALLLCKKLEIEPAALQHPLMPAFSSLDELEKALFQVPNVCEVSLSRRYISGTPIKEWCVRVLVREKLAKSRLRPEWVLPTAYHGIPIDVVESHK